jgi:hypothetical protein
MCRTCNSRALVFYARTGQFPNPAQYEQEWRDIGCGNLINRDNMLNQLERLHSGKNAEQAMMEKWKNMYRDADMRNDDEYEDGVDKEARANFYIKIWKSVFPDFTVIRTGRGAAMAYLRQASSS